MSCIAPIRATSGTGQPCAKGAWKGNPEKPLRGERARYHSCRRKGRSVFSHILPDNVKAEVQSTSAEMIKGVDLPHACIAVCLCVVSGCVFSAAGRVDLRVDTYTSAQSQATSRLSWDPHVPPHRVSGARVHLSGLVSAPPEGGFNSWAPVHTSVGPPWSWTVREMQGTLGWCRGRRGGPFLYSAWWSKLQVLPCALGPCLCTLPHIAQ